VESTVDSSSVATFCTDRRARRYTTLTVHVLRASFPPIFFARSNPTRAYTQTRRWIIDARHGCSWEMGQTAALCTMLKVVARYRVFEFDSCESTNGLIMSVGHNIKIVEYYPWLEQRFLWVHCPRQASLSIAPLFQIRTSSRVLTQFFSAHAINVDDHGFSSDIELHHSLSSGSDSW
jgi:hypothetical protein